MRSRDSSIISCLLINEKKKTTNNNASFTIKAKKNSLQRMIGPSSERRGMHSSRCVQSYNYYHQPTNNEYIPLHLCTSGGGKKFQREKLSLLLASTIPPVPRPSKISSNIKNLLTRFLLINSFTISSSATTQHNPIQQ